MGLGRLGRPEPGKGTAPERVWDPVCGAVTGEGELPEIVFDDDQSGQPSGEVLSDLLERLELASDEPSLRTVEGVSVGGHGLWRAGREQGNPGGRFPRQGWNASDPLLLGYLGSDHP